MSIQSVKTQPDWLLKNLVVSTLSVVLLSSCGNKGDLFLVSDSITVEDLENLQRELDADDVPTANPNEVDDGAVFIDLEAESGGKRQDSKSDSLTQ